MLVRRASSHVLRRRVNRISGGDGPGVAEEDWPRPSCRLEGDPKAAQTNSAKFRPVPNDLFRHAFLLRPGECSVRQPVVFLGDLENGHPGLGIDQVFGK
jgi:hypothetical protein